MRDQPYDAGARTQALTQRLAEQVRADIRQDGAALNAFVTAHGSFAEMVREHYATADTHP